MCGIFCQVRRSAEPPGDAPIDFLRRRGPDAYGEHVVPLKELGLHIHFISTVLSLRGRDIVEQPLVDQKTGSVLCWNGEAWRLDGMPVKGNDTQTVFDLLTAAAQPQGDLIDHQVVISSVTKALSRISGPYAVVYYEATTKTLFYGRDCLGRRSLLWHFDNTKTSLTISSVCDSAVSTQPWAEVEADGTRVLQLTQTADMNRIGQPRTEQAFPTTTIQYHQQFPGLNRSTLSSNTAQQDAIPELKRVLHDALEIRATDIRSHVTPPDEVNSGVCHPAEVAVLFSGGLDCTLLARMLHDILPPSFAIDLLNVAFENPRIHHSDTSGTSPFELCPDRMTARRSHAELQELCPDRSWNLICIDTPYSETVAHRNTVVSLMHPHNTEMDLSIALALYFASRGEGYLSTSKESRPYSSPARVLVSGLGADELFGGYQRHSTAFARLGISGLLDELDLDFKRLGKRNLGRDDRVMSHWGKEVRFPYLDEGLVTWALDAPIWAKCGFGTDFGDGLDPEKRILRLLTRDLGLTGVASEKKRAIQFGARSAKMQTGNVKGTQLIT